MKIIKNILLLFICPIMIGWLGGYIINKCNVIVGIIFILIAWGLILLIHLITKPFKYEHKGDCDGDKK